MTNRKSFKKAIISSCVVAVLLAVYIWLGKYAKVMSETVLDPIPKALLLYCVSPALFATGSFCLMSWLSHIGVQITCTRKKLVLILAIIFILPEVLLASNYILIAINPALQFTALTKLTFFFISKGYVAFSMIGILSTWSGILFSLSF